MEPIIGQLWICGHDSLDRLMNFKMTKKFKIPEELKYFLSSIALQEDTTLIIKFAAKYDNIEVVSRLMSTISENLWIT